MNQFGSVPPGSAQVCGRCEALLMDVLDGAASAEDQRFFETHMASCAGCSQMLADARRGGAWLEMLRNPRPEPPVALFERILAQTSGLAVRDAALTGRGVVPGVPVAVSVGPVDTGAPLTAAAYSSPKPVQYGSVLKVLPFRVRGTMHRLSQTMLQPRLAMTAAMAFFSIALTLNLTGVHVGALRISDLRPANLRRGFYAANAHVVRYCDNLRVVYELEARAHDLQRSSDNDSSPATRDDGQTSAPKEPASRDQRDDQPAAPKTEPKTAPKTAPKTGPGTSRKESLTRDDRLVAAHDTAGFAGRQHDGFLVKDDVKDDASLLRTMHLKGDPA